MITRRTALGAIGTGMAGLPLTARAETPAALAKRKRMAIVTTEWRYMSHAWHMG